MYLIIDHNNRHGINLIIATNDVQLPSATNGDDLINGGRGAKNKGKVQSDMLLLMTLDMLFLKVATII